MSGLSSLRIALSGFGGAVLSVALSGFVVEVDAPIVSPPAVVSEGGGGRRHRQQQAARQERERERIEQLRADDEAVVLAIVAFVTGESG